MAAAAPQHPRRVLRDFVSPELCKELEFIHRSCGTVGYRPSVFSTALPHLAITNCIHLILPFLLLRDRLKDVVEVTFGCKYELFIEFTGVIRFLNVLEYSYTKIAGTIKKVLQLGTQLHPAAAQ